MKVTKLVSHHNRENDGRPLNPPPAFNPVRQALTELRILRPRTWASVEGLVRLTGARPADVVAALIDLDSEGAIEKKKLLGLPCFRLAKVGV